MRGIVGLILGLVFLVPLADAQPPAHPFGRLTVVPEERAAFPGTDTAAYEVRFEWSCSQFELENGFPQEFRLSLDARGGAHRLKAEFDKSDFWGQLEAPSNCHDDTPQRNLTTILRTMPTLDWPAGRPLNFTVVATFSQWGARSQVPGMGAGARFLQQYHQNGSLTMYAEANARLAEHQVRGVAVHETRMLEEWQGMMWYRSNEELVVDLEIKPQPGSPDVTVTDFEPRSLQPTWVRGLSEQKRLSASFAGDQEDFELGRGYPLIIVWTLRNPKTNDILETVEAEAAVYNPGNWAGSTPKAIVTTAVALSIALDMLIAIVVLTTMLWRRASR